MKGIFIILITAILTITPCETNSLAAEQYFYSNETYSEVDNSSSVAVTTYVSNKIDTDLSLKSLIINGTALNIEDGLKKYYGVKVPTGTLNISIVAKANNENVAVTVNGPSIFEGETVNYEIVVSDGDKSNIYKLVVVRKEKETTTVAEHLLNLFDSLKLFFIAIFFLGIIWGIVELIRFAHKKRVH